MRISILFIFLIIFELRAADTLYITRNECETIFLRENLFLMSERLNIDQAQALVLQSKLWHNPKITIEEVNLWATPHQLTSGETLPPYFGNFGRNTQLSASIEQLITTAGKRRKMVDIAEVGVDIAKEYFEDLLRNLKIEFRNYMTELQYLQQFKSRYIKQLDGVKQISFAFKRQHEEGNIGKAEYLRIKALEIEFLKELNEISTELNHIQNELKMLMKLEPDAELVINDDGYLPELSKVRNLNLNDLTDKAVQSRPDLRAAKLDEDYYLKILAYERALRVPDIELSMGYDRGGNFLRDFIGFGVSFDLPIFNRNQGNIKIAEFGKQRSELFYQLTMNRVMSQVNLAHKNLLMAVQFYDSLDENYSAEYDEMLDSYTRNMLSRNVSLLEYIDFLKAYIESEKIILESKKDINIKFEELQFELGNDI